METAQEDRAPADNFNTLPRICQEVKINKNNRQILLNLPIDIILCILVRI